MTDGQADDPPEDHDLLTYAEAAIRMTKEIATQRALVDDLRAAGQLEAAEKARTRLGMLTDALERTTNQSISGDDFTRFFGDG